MDAVSTHETSTNFYEITLLNIPEESQSPSSESVFRNSSVISNCVILNCENKVVWPRNVRIRRAYGFKPDLRSDTQTTHSHNDVQVVTFNSASYGGVIDRSIA